VVQRQQERLLRSGVVADELLGARTQQVGEIALAMDFALVLPQVVLAATRAMREVVDAAGERSEEVVVAALQRTEVRGETEMPFADQRGRVAGLAQQRWQR